MFPRPPRSTLTDTLFPVSTPFLSYSRSPHQGLVRRLPDRSPRARGRAPRSERCASSAPMTDESLAKLAKMLRFGNFRLGHETLLQEDVEALFERNSVGFRRE